MIPHQHPTATHTRELGARRIDAALAHTTPPQNILHPSRIIRINPPGGNKPVDILAFSQSTGAFLRIPADESPDSRIFVCAPDALEEDLLPDGFDIGNVTLHTPCYVSFGLQKHWQLHHEHFIDGFYARIENGRLCILFTTICPGLDYSVPVNLKSFPDVMLECSLEWEMGESLGSSMQAYLDAEVRKERSFPIAEIGAMIRMAVTALDYIECHRGEFRLGYPGLPNTPVEYSPAERRAGRVAAFIHS